MPGKRRRFTIGEKRQILKQAAEVGVGKALREHRLSYSVYARWKKQSQSDESEFEHILLQQRLHDLTHENFRLKKIIADLMLNLESLKTTP
ncbi:transposase [Chitinophaga lutea]